MKVIAETTRAEPDYRPLARAVLEACREFYSKPENVQAYLDWKKNGQHKENR